MPEAVNEDAPFTQLERSDLFAFLLDLIQRVYRPSVLSAVNDYGLVIVGGQSLTLWARQYLIDEMTGEDVGFVTSDDLDFIGKPNSIDYCARMMGVPFRKAKMEDNTINIAAAYIDWIDDKEVIVDILEMDSVGGAPRDFQLFIRPGYRRRASRRNRPHHMSKVSPVQPICLLAGSAAQGIRAGEDRTSRLEPLPARPACT
jgi:hypothetical protein